MPSPVDKRRARGNDGPLIWALKKLGLFVAGYLFCDLLVQSGNDGLIATGAMLGVIPMLGIVVMVVTLLLIALLMIVRRRA